MLSNLSTGERSFSDFSADSYAEIMRNIVADELSLLVQEACFGQVSLIIEYTEKSQSYFYF